MFAGALLCSPSFQDSEYLVTIITLNYVVSSNKRSSFRRSLRNRNAEGPLTGFVGLYSVGNRNYLPICKSQIS